MEDPKLGINIFFDLFSDSNFCAVISLLVSKILKAMVESCISIWNIVL